MEAGEHITLEWVVDNILNEGTHYVDVTFAHDNASMVSDRWPEATSFKVYKGDGTPYLVKPPISVSTHIVAADDSKRSKKEN
jgi:hypothetical protein